MSDMLSKTLVLALRCLLKCHYHLVLLHFRSVPHRPAAAAVGAVVAAAAFAVVAYATAAASASAAAGAWKVESGRRRPPTSPSGTAGWPSSTVSLGWA